MCQTFLFHKHKEMKSSVKRVHASIVNFVDLRVLPCTVNFREPRVSAHFSCSGRNFHNFMPGPRIPSSRFFLAVRIDMALLFARPRLPSPNLLVRASKRAFPRRFRKYEGGCAHLRYPLRKMLSGLCMPPLSSSQRPLCENKKKTRILPTSHAPTKVFLWDVHKRLQFATSDPQAHHATLWGQGHPRKKKKKTPEFRS